MGERILRVLRLMRLSVRVAKRVGIVIDRCYTFILSRNSAKCRGHKFTIEYNYVGTSFAVFSGRIIRTRRARVAAQRRFANGSILTRIAIALILV